MIDISGLDHADVLRVLYDNASAQGMGILHYTPEPMAREEAAELLAVQTRFDYLKGRVMKIKIEGDEISPGLYDRDNGEGAAAAAIETLRQ